MFSANRTAYISTACTPTYIVPHTEGSCQFSESTIEEPEVAERKEH